MGATSYADTADLIGAMLEAVGFVVDIRLFESSVWSARYSSTGDFTNVAFGAASDSSFDYGNSLIDNTCPNGAYFVQTDWCNERYNELVDMARVEFDTATRVELLAEATEILIEERPQYYLYASATFVGVSHRVDFQPRADSLIVLSQTRPAAD
jgi:ABC-type transport system substrate-binding protein